MSCNIKKSTHLKTIQIATGGEVKQVKILGTVAMIDEGETDWKLFCIDVNDPLAKDMNGKDESYLVKVCTFPPPEVENAGLQVALASNSY